MYKYYTIDTLYKYYTIPMRPRPEPARKSSLLAQDNSAASSPRQALTSFKLRSPRAERLDSRRPRFEIGGPATTKRS